MGKKCFFHSSLATSSRVQYDGQKKNAAAVVNEAFWMLLTVMWDVRVVYCSAQQVGIECPTLHTAQSDSTGAIFYYWQDEQARQRLVVFLSSRCSCAGSRQQSSFLVFSIAPEKSCQCFNSIVTDTNFYTSLFQSPPRPRILDLRSIDDGKEWTLGLVLAASCISLER